MIGRHFLLLFTMTTELLQGVWQREFEEDPLGDSENADRDTLVLWTQSPKSGIYVDIRLPKGSLGRQETKRGFEIQPAALRADGLNVLNLDNVSESDIETFYRQKSFAGVLQYSAGDTTSGEALKHDKPLSELASSATTSNGALELCTCFWKREVDYQPPSGGLDVGVCASAPPNADGSIDLRETGDDASYAEGWHRLPGSNFGPFVACRLLAENGVERTGFWVRTGKFFAYAVGRPSSAEASKALKCSASSYKVKECVGKILGEAVSELSNNPHDKLSLVGAYVAVFGEVSEAGDWNILHSTNPLLVGCTLFGNGTDKSCSQIRSERENSLQEGDMFHQDLVCNGPVRIWQVVEVEGIFPWTK